MIARPPLAPQQTPFVLMPLAELAHVRTRFSKGAAHVDAMVAIIRSWPADLSTVQNIYSLVLPPIGIRRVGPRGMIFVRDGNHRLIAARLACVDAIYVCFLDEYGNVSPNWRS